MSTPLTRQLEMMAERESLYDFARKLAIALADEVAFHGEDDSAEASLQILGEARERLELQEEFDNIDSILRPSKV